MDQLLHALDATKNRRRTTYKKIIRADDTEQPESSIPAVVGDGFLFQSNVLDRVRNRLNNEHSVTTQLSETMVLSNLYGDAEEVEKETTAVNEWNVKVAQPTQRGKQKESVRIATDGPVDERSPTTKVKPKEVSPTGQEPITESRPDTSVSEETQRIAEYTDELSRTQVLSPAEGPELATEVVATMESQSKSSQDPDTLTFCDHETAPDMDLQATAADNNLFTKLKIHEIQDELDKEDGPTYTEVKIQSKTPKQNVVFSREAFMEDFDNSSDSDVEEQEEQAEFAPIASDTDKTDNTSRSLPTSGALNAYQRELKERIELNKGITLSSESDDSEDDEISPSFASKATVLEIRARLSKRRKQPKVQKGGPSLTALMDTLRKASKKQILECQKEMVERHGLNLEDIEKEKEMVENLLEQEIARNKRIRMREKGKDETDERTSSNLPADQPGFSFKRNEEYEGGESDELSLSGSNSDDSELELDQNEPFQSAQQVPSDNDNAVDDSDDDSVSKSKSKAHKAPILSENDSDEDDESSKDGIDLGSYGGNLSTKSPGGESEPDEDEDTQQLSEELESQQRKLTKEKMKQTALIERQKLNEMKNSGVSNMFDMEAEESEDEWHGLGGTEGEIIEDYDSDLERMIDDFSHTTSSADHIRQLLIAENKETDLKTVNKILHDLKNGGFRKRRHNDLELELSDDDDDELRNYRKRRLESMRKKRLQLGQNNSKLLKNTKSSAFFESMLEDLVDAKNPFEKHEVLTEEQVSSAKSIEGSSKKTVAISEEFVQRSLSFLTSSRDTREFEVSQPSVAGPGIDLLSLKRDSSVKTLHTPHAAVVQAENDTDALPSEDSYVSIVQSFGQSTDPENKLKDGRKTVTVSKSYRTVGGSKASVTYLAQMRKLVAPKPKNARPFRPKMDELASVGKSKIFGSFESSFET